MQSGAAQRVERWGLRASRIASGIQQKSGSGRPPERELLGLAGLGLAWLGLAWQIIENAANHHVKRLRQKI
jgi:hypothetical protein